MVKRLLSSVRFPLTASAGGLLGVVVLLGYLELNPQAGRYTDADIRRLADDRISQITPAVPLEPEIYALLRPSVVLVMRDPNNRDAGVGSGVVVDEFGNILTSYHVVAGLDRVTVRFWDGSTQVATVDVEQADRDLAILHVDFIPNSVAPAVLSGGVRPGDRVMAIGAPFGLEGSVSSGVVSATGRTFLVEETGQILTNMIQFDASVNPGNSGGPLVDLSGRVVGVVTGLVNPTKERVFVGLGFAVPIEAAGSLLPPLG